MALGIECQLSLFDHPELHAAVETMADTGGQERLYTTTTIMASPRTAADKIEFADLSELTGLKTFITSFAGHIAAEAGRR